MKRLIYLSIILLVCASCSRKVTQRETNHTTASSDTARVSAALTASDIRTLTELFTLSISTNAMMFDSIHTHIHTETTIDAEGNVIGRTMTEDTDRTRVGTSSSGSSSDHHVEASDSTSAASSATASRVSEENSNHNETCAEAVENQLPWWRRAPGSGILIIIAIAGLAGLVAIFKRWKAYRRI